MSDILIYGMGMPVFEHQSWDIRRGTDRKWYVIDTNAETSDGEWHEIIPVPPHGRLIDAAKVYEDIDNIWAGRGLPPIGAKVLSTVYNSPTIIPASEEVE